MVKAKVLVVLFGNLNKEERQLDFEYPNCLFLDKLIK